MFDSSCLALLLFGREAAHYAGENNELALIGAADGGKFDASGRPGQRAGFALGEWGKNGERIRASAAGVAAKFLVALPDRHGHDIGSDPRRENRGRADASVLRSDFDEIS